MNVSEILINIATSLRSRLDAVNASLIKKGQAAVDTYDDIPAKIEAIETGADVSGVTATPNDVLSPKVFVNSSGEEKTGNIQTKGESGLSVSGARVTTSAGYYPSAVSKSVGYANFGNMNISLDEDTGVVSASTSISTSGYIAAGETKGDTFEIPTHSGGTFTPKKSYQDIPKNVYLTNPISIEGDANFIPENIAKGKTIWGVTGTHEGGSPATFGEYLSASGSATNQITFSVDTTNLIGFTVVIDAWYDADGENVSNEPVLSIVHDISTSYGLITTLMGSMAAGARGNDFYSITTSSNSLTIILNTQEYEMCFDTRYALFPIYSKSEA